MGRGIPDRWDAYSAFGTVIRGTRFLPFKVPLKESLCKDLPAEQRFTPAILIEKLRAPQQQQQPMQLGLVIDLTNTNRYYSPQEITKHNVRYEKIFTEGHNVPGDAVQRRFKEIVDRFLWDNSGNGLLIGVHCTHGVNRTGYLVCRYMIDRMQALPVDAINTFNEGRGHVIERENYLDHLISVSTAPASDGELRSAAGGPIATFGAATSALPHSRSEEPWPSARDPAAGRTIAQQSCRWQQQQQQQQQRGSRKPGRQRQQVGEPRPADNLAAPAARSSHAFHHAAGDPRGREEWATSKGNRPREDDACRREEWPAAAAVYDDGRCLAGGASTWDRPPDARQFEWTAPAAAAEARRRDALQCRTLSDPGRFCSMPPAVDRTGWQPWQQLPSRSGSWVDVGGSCRGGSRAQQRPLAAAAVRPAIPGYCPVVLGPQRPGAGRADGPKLRQQRGGASRR